MGEAIDISEMLGQRVRTQQQADQDKRAADAKAYAVAIRPKVLEFLTDVTFRCQSAERSRGGFKSTLTASKNAAHVWVLATVRTTRPLGWDETYTWAQIRAMRHWVRCHVGSAEVKINGGKL